ncbi:phospholipid N-methyltransferase PmtA [Notoacmeibacter sp. MSK16QG-6]|uniref:phospholipid N-methyltransferase PmtA n=1 Tax=Notoacmeibacter sp. MSK16QG-6 TaxID=2957982 RepID=UPI00209DC668|nr:class I SAM-dependent methyltransferase [Notoacmeibacter sp. MSK16QG-6]MCP1198939.1 class I SAM-dependent methyltransferase [Notoacmeibacter sp. MSK16QG-6]
MSQAVRKPQKRARFNEEIRFFKGWLADVKAVGAILPTSSVTARVMASVVDVSSGLPVLELGPGTGVITKAILERGIAPDQLYSVEYSKDFADHLKIEFPDVNIIQGDAFDLDTTLGDKKDQTFDCVICAVPLIYIPVEQRAGLVEDLLDRVKPGRPVIQITYAPKSPIPAGSGNFEVVHYDYVLRNVPPANLFVYRRPA